MKTFEYKTVNLNSDNSILGGKFICEDVDQAINKYGAEGWELVSVVPSNKVLGETGNLILFFKREK